MAKSQSPLLGYNNNVRHRGRVFHIQTEDSGAARPHVITHLFADGGRILKTTKTSYADRVEEPNLGAFVKKLMQDQHKAMFIALRDGQFDAMLTTLTDNPVVADAPALAPAPAPTPETTAAAKPTVEVPSPTPAPIDPGRLSGPIIDIDADHTIEIAPEEIPALMTEVLEDDRSTLPPDPPFEVPTPPPIAEPLHRAPPPRSSLQPVRVAGLRAVVGPARSLNDPPPLAPSPGASTVPPPTPVATSGSAPPPLPRISQPPPLPSGGRSPASTGRYVAPRPPASVAANARPREVHASIFAESLVSERSLDEVILAYLAEELGNPPRT